MNENKTIEFGKDRKNCNEQLEQFFKILKSLIIKNIDFASRKTAGDNGLVIAIDAKWGGGKTTFLNIFKDEIEKKANVICDEENNNHKVKFLTYNAWENDYFDNPFSSFVGQFCEQLKDLNNMVQKEFIDQAYSLSKVITHLLSPIPVLNILSKLMESSEKVVDEVNKMQEKSFDIEISSSWV
jgi:hypothetical protein